MSELKCFIYYSILLVIIFLNYCAIPDRTNPSDPKSEFYEAITHKNEDIKTAFYQ
jgi:hypothetical protein